MTGTFVDAAAVPSWSSELYCKYPMTTSCVCPCTCVVALRTWTGNPGMSLYGIVSVDVMADDSPANPEPQMIPMVGDGRDVSWRSRWSRYEAAFRYDDVSSSLELLALQVAIMFNNCKVFSVIPRVLAKIFLRYFSQ